MQRAWLLIPLVLVLLGALLWSQRRSGPYMVSGILEADDIRVGSRVGGRIQEIRIREGDRVSAAQALVLFEPYQLNELLAQARADLAARSAELERLEAGPRAEEIAQARAERDRQKAILERVEAGMRPLEIHILESRLAIAEAELRNAEREFRRVQTLFERTDASQDELDRATYARDARAAAVAAARDELALAREGNRREDIDEARARLASMQAALDLLEAGYRKEDIAEARASVQAAEARVAAIERQLEELSVVAPRDSVVEALDLEPGDLVPPDAPVVSLIDPTSLYVRAYVPENRMNLQLGQRVELRVDSFPGRSFHGHISYISRSAEFTPANVQTPEERSKQVFRIKVVLDDGHDVLRAGMAADVILEPAAAAPAARPASP